MDDDKIIHEFAMNYQERYIAECIRETKKGNGCYVYTRENLNIITELLDSKKIKYTITEFDAPPCWYIKGGNYGRNSKRNQA